MDKEKLKMRGEITVEVRDNGKKVLKKKIKNLIVDAGLAATAGNIGGLATADPFTYIALGTGTTAAAAGDTTLEAEETGNGFERTNATVSLKTTTATNDTHVLVAGWTATGDVSISEIGMFNDASAGTMLGRQAFTAIPMTIGREMRITYEIICS